MFGYEIIRMISLPLCRVFSSRAEIGLKSACPWSLLLPPQHGTARHGTAVSRASPSLGSTGHCMSTSSHACFTSTYSIACNDLRLWFPSPRGGVDITAHPWPNVEEETLVKMKTNNNTVWRSRFHTVVVMNDAGPGADQMLWDDDV